MSVNRLKTAIARNRYEAICRTKAESQVTARQTNLSVTHAGYSDGAYIGKLSGGGIVRVKSSSNGAIAKGEVYNTRRSRTDNQLQGNWQNYSG